MTWSFSATGHIQSEPNTEQAERKLAKQLADAVNALPADDVVSAVFTGNHFSGDVRSIDIDVTAAPDGVIVSDEPLDEQLAEQSAAANEASAPSPGGGATTDGDTVIDIDDDDIEEV
jgi:hypothetical protein